MCNSRAILVTAMCGLLVVSTSWAQDETKPRDPANKPPAVESAKPNRLEMLKRQSGDSGKMAKLGYLKEVIGHLELNDDQRAEIQAILKETVDEMRSAMGKGAMKMGDSAALKSKRDELVAKFQSQGLEGKELKQAVMQAIGKDARPKAGERPKDAMVQYQADLISKIRDILTGDQQEKLDELLRSQAEARKTHKQDKQSDPPKTDRKRPGKGGQ